MPVYALLFNYIWSTVKVAGIICSIIPVVSVIKFTTLNI